MNRSAESTESGATERLRQHTATLAGDLSELGRLGKDAAREVAVNVYQKGRQKVSDGRAHVEEYVRNRPMKSLMFAVGTGAVVGFLLARRWQGPPR